MGPSLRARALLVLATLTALPLIVASVASVVGRRDPDAAAAQLEREATALGRVVSRSPESARDALVRAQAEAGGRFRLVDGDGRFVATIGERHRPNLVERAQAFLFGDSHLPPSPPLSRVTDAPELVDAYTLAAQRGAHATCRAADEGRQLRCHAFARAGEGFVLLERAERQTVGALVEQRYQVLRLSFFILPWALLAGAWLAWRMIRPIERLRHEVELRAKMASPTADLPTGRKDELGALARAFNQLATRLSDRTKENEAFVADLAHEFKSPVAALRAASEKLNEAPTDPARVQRLARIVDDSSARLERVLDDFLLLARAEAGWDEADYEPVDLVALSEAVLDAARSGPRGHELELSVHAGDGPVRVLAIPERIEVAVANLVENAASFAESRVIVDVGVDGEVARLAVIDDGPGIAEADRAQVFDRFFTRRSGAGGTGLGLSIARAIVDAHAGWMEVDAAEGGGARLVMWLPAATDAFT